MSDQEQPNDKGPFWNLVHLNPALWIGLVVAVLAVLGTFGLAVSGEQKESIITLLLAVVAILQGVWTGSKTTANKKVVVQAPDPIAQPHVVAPGEAMTQASPGAIINAANSSPRHAAK